MISSHNRREYDEPGTHDGFGRSVTIRYAAAFAVVAVLTLTAYLTLESAIIVQRATAAAIESAEQQQVSSQRIANLTAQYALGNSSLQRDLHAAVDSFARVQRHIDIGDPDTAAAANAYLAQLRAALAVAPQDSSLKGHAASVVAAQRPLLDALAATIRLREDRAERQFALLGHAGSAFFILVLALLLAGALAVFRPMARRIVALSREVGELARLVTTDPITGMLNKRSFQDRGEIEIQKARRYQRPLSLLVIGADQLPAIEAAFGPDGGKSVLKALTSSFCDATRVSDLIARVDEEQFAILLPETSSKGAELLAERLRQRVGDMTLHIDDKPVACTISVGVAAAEKDATFLWSTFKRADEALYEAKMRGRNRVFVAA